MDNIGKAHNDMNCNDKSKRKNYSTEYGDGDTAVSPWPDGAGMIYLGMSPWHGMWKNRHQLMTRFAKHIPVLYVEPPLGLRQVRKNGKLLSSIIKPSTSDICRHFADKLHIFGQSSRLPVSGSRLLGDISENRWSLAVKRAARSIGIRYPILWLSQPVQYSLLGKFAEAISIYHVVDEYAGYTGRSPTIVERNFDQEQRLLDKVTMTIVVSPELAASKSTARRKVSLVENAVDFESFDKARIRANEPTDLASIKGPRIGYSGLIGKRLDFGLIRHLAKRRPNYSIVLIGDIDDRECKRELSELERLDNVYFLGRKAPQAVPDYIAGFTAGILPYALNLETENISPLKMYEYLAIGLPIISSPIPSARRNSAFVQIVKSNEAFVDACDKAIYQTIPDVEERIRAASLNTWEHRIAQITELVFPHLVSAIEIADPNHSSSPKKTID